MDGWVLVMAVVYGRLKSLLPNLSVDSFLCSYARLYAWSTSDGLLNKFDNSLLCEDNVMLLKALCFGRCNCRAMSVLLPYWSLLTWGFSMILLFLVDPSALPFMIF